jgi:hypothetical protein
MIQSPGVEINEIDLSLRLPTPAGTTIYATGFSDQGPVDEVVQVSSINEFEQIYGLPKTPAERYFYHTVKACASSQARVLVNRLPYGASTGDGFGSYVSVLAYPAIVSRKDQGPSSAIYTTLTSYASPLTGSPLSSVPATFTDSDTLSSELTYFLGAPRQFTLTQTQYSGLLAGSYVTWKDSVTAFDGATTPAEYIGAAAVVVINKGQSTINNQGHGYYIGIADNTAINPASAYNSILDVYTTSISAGNAGITKTNYTKIPTTRLDFALSAEPGFVQNSVSQVMEEGIVPYDISSGYYNDTLTVGVFKLRQSVFSNRQDNNALTYIREEGYNGSIGHDRTKPNQDGPAANFFLENIESGSRNIEILVNPYISNANSVVPLNADGSPKRKIRVLTKQLLSIATSDGTDVVGANQAQINSFINKLGSADALFPIGSYTDSANSLKVIGEVPSKIDRALEGIRNSEIYDVDILVEGGLGTIYNTTKALGVTYFNDTAHVSSIDNLRTSSDLTSNDSRDNYTTVFNKFANFAGPPKDGGRGDILFLADPLRQILVTGKESKILSDKTRIFTKDVYWALRHQFELTNTSYAATYANYLKVLDDSSGVYNFIPPSGFVAAKIVATDFEIGPWGAPAGFNRGILTNVVDVAITPNQHQRDSLYQININPIATFADQGIVVFGQKTLLKKPSAFDRINVRRTFLYLEKATKSVMRFFIFENNTLFTRARVINTLSPFFERVKAADGLYDYLIVCDERNNTPEVIDNNELIVDIYLKPVRTAEFIRVNFYATRTDANFEELAGG